MYCEYYILGVMLGDGYFLYSKNQRAHLVCLKSKDLDFVEKFKTNFEKLFNYQGKIIQEKNKSCKQGFHFLYKACCKKAWEYLKNLKNDYKKNVSNSSKEMKIAFLEGLYDSEGCITNKKTMNKIIFNNSNESLIYFVSYLLNEFNISTKKYSTLKKCGMYYELNIQRRTELLKFFNIINFSILRKKERVERVKETIQNSKYPLIRADFNKVTHLDQKPS